MCQNNEITHEKLLQKGFTYNNGIYEYNGLCVACIDNIWCNIVIHNGKPQILNSFVGMSDLEYFYNNR